MKTFNRIMLGIYATLSLVTMTLSFMFFTANIYANIEKWHFFIEKFYSEKLFFIGTFAVGFILFSSCVVAHDILNAKETKNV